MERSVWEGVFRVFGVDVKCHILSNGQRIIEAESIENLLAAISAGESKDLGELDALNHWRRGENVKGTQ